MGTLRVVVCLGGLFVVACGGSSSDGSGTCSDVNACGGDVVGSWTVESSCLTVDTSDMVSASCPGMTTKPTGWKITGTASFDADQTFDVNMTISGGVVVTVPKSCLTQMGVTATCSQLQQALQAQTTEVDSPFSSATCGGASDGCSCTMTMKPIPSSSTGTYSTEGGLLTQMHASGTVGQSDYCVKGGKLSISEHDGMGEMSNVSGTIVFGK